MPDVVMEPYRLTDAQRQFAGEHCAKPVLRSDSDRRMVFMYRSDALSTSRWLVDHLGRVVDSAVFRSSDARG